MTGRLEIAKCACRIGYGPTSVNGGVIKRLGLLAAGAKYIKVTQSPTQASRE